MYTVIKNRRGEDGTRGFVADSPNWIDFSNSLEMDARSPLTEISSPQAV